MAVLGSLLAVHGAAEAETFKPTVIWKNRIVKRPADPAAFTSVSHVLYLNDCKNGSCNVKPGNDNSRTNTSSIPEANVVLNAYPWGQAHWDGLVACVKKTFEPIDIDIVTVNPGNVPHFEVMIGGSSEQLHPQLQAGGVAPFLGCGASEPDVISFVFPETTDNTDFLCGAVAQEACHVWGLDHEMDAADPMTYLELGTHKEFQDNDADCGEFDPRGCGCPDVGLTPNTQNSLQFMWDTFGPKTLTDASLSITSPKPNQFVKPGFAITAVLDSQLSGGAAFLKIDGEDASSRSKEPYDFTGPQTLTAGLHTLQIQASDKGGRVVMAEVQVNALASCSSGPASCADGQHCLNSICYPDAAAPGGLGATCATDGECATGTCASDGTEMRCTAPCDAGMKCPDGYECLGANNGGGVCWVADAEAAGGCCSTSSDAPPPAMFLAGLGLVGLLSRRRRR